jgi:putative transposase
MARMYRVVLPDYPHHITQRGNRRLKTFFCANYYRYYLELMSEYSGQANTDIRAYCFRPNHVNLVMVPRQKDGLRSAMGECRRRYTRHINFREGFLSKN